MGRTTLEYDDKLLSEARKALGTRGIKATIDAALREAILDTRRQQFAAAIRTGEPIGPTPDELKQLRAPAIDSFDLFL